MVFVKVDDFEPGMVLAADLKSPQGRMLLPRGAMLTEKHIRTCKIWGIVEGDIEGDDLQQDEERTVVLDPMLLERARVLAKDYFVLTDIRHPLVREAVKLFIERTAKALASNDEYCPVAMRTDSGQTGRFLPMPEDIEAIVRQDLEMASHPEVFRHILHAANDPCSSTDYVADVVSKDVALSVKLLKVVNTPYYGFPQKVDTLSRAIVLLGQNKIVSLALGISVISMFKGLDNELLDMAAFWKHSVACGVIGRILAVHCDEQEEERFFVAGLLHDLGRLIMLKNRLESVRHMLVDSRCRKVALPDMERAMWGFNHAELGQRVLQEWNLPDNLVLAVGYHHVPEICGWAREACVTHVSDFLAHGMVLGRSGATLVPPLNPQAWESLGLSKNVLPTLARQVDRQVADIMRIFFG